MHLWDQLVSSLIVTDADKLPFQVESHRKAAAATASGKFKDEIIPVKTKVQLATSVEKFGVISFIFSISLIFVFDMIFFCSDACLRKIVDPKSGDEKPVTISVDDGIRPSTTLGDLGKLKAVFKKDGTTTAGKQVPHHTSIWSKILLS